MMNLLLKSLYVFSLRRLKAYLSLYGYRRLACLVTGGKFNLIQHVVFSSKAELTTQIPLGPWTQ